MSDEKENEIKGSPALSFLIGAFLGDGYKQKVKKLGGYDYCINFGVTDRDFVENFIKAVRMVLPKKKVRIRVKYREGRKPLYVATFSSKLLFEFLDQPLPNILKIALLHPIPFLQGFFDAEGYVAVDKRKVWRVGVSNSNLTLLKVVQDVLNKLGIENRLEIDTNRRDCKKVWKVVISRKNSIKRFKEMVNFTIKRKKENLEKLR